MTRSVMASLLDVNRLQYTRGVDGSLVRSRTIKKFPANKDSYSPGNLLSIILNTGDAFVDGPNSYLKVKMKGIQKEAAKVTDFGSGSCFNIINSARLTHQSGDDIEYNHSANLQAHILTHWATSKEEFEATRDLYGAGATSPTVVGGGADSVTNTEFILPLKYLFGCFARTDQLIPSNMLAGATLELQFENQEFAFVTDAAAGAATEPVISWSVELHLDTYDLYDSARKDLMMQASDSERSGLQFTYDTFFMTSTNLSSSTLNLDIMKSATKIKRVAVAVVNKATGGDPVPPPPIGQDFFNFVLPYNTVQFRLGSQYTPALPSTSKGEYYHHSLLAYQNEHSAQILPAVKYDEYADPAAPSGAVIKGARILAQTFERNSMDNSGQTTNNSQLINLSGSVAQKANAERTIYVFVQYTRIANLLQSNLVLDT